MRCRHARGGRALEHLLDEIDASARSIELVAQKLVRRTGGIAETAMHASADDGLRALRAARREELWRKLSMHGQRSAYSRPGLRILCGSNLLLSSRCTRMSAVGSGAKNSA